MPDDRRGRDFDRPSSIAITRRQLLERAGRLGAGLAAGPVIAWGALGDPGGRRAPIDARPASEGRAGRFTILHTSDIHGQLFTHDEFFFEDNQAVYRRRGGFAVLKTMIDSLRAADPANTILVDGGDCIQGSGVAALSRGQAIVPLMNGLGYDLVVPGNWEVVYGKAMMLENLGGEHAAKICANMFHETPDGKSGELLFPPYWTKTLGGVKVGFIGYTDPLTPKRQSPAYSKGIRFVRPETNVAGYVEILRGRERCAAVILVTHLGLAQQVDLANQPLVEGVDLILGGDTHERVRRPIHGKHSLVTEPGAFGSFIGRLDLTVENDRVRDVQYQLLDVDPDRYPPNAEMARLVEAAKAPYRAQLDRVVGRTKTTLVRYYVIDNPMDNLVTDALLWRLKPDVAVSNGFRFAPPIVVDPAKGSAAITNDDLWSIAPVDSETKYGTVTGHQIQDWLERELHNVFAEKPSERFGGWVVRFSGMRVNFTIRAPMGKRVNWVKIGDRPLDPGRKYRIAACEREGDPDETLCRIDRVANPKRAGITIHAVLREYLAKFSPVSPAMDDRIVATDGSPSLLSQLEGYDYQFR